MKQRNGMISNMEQPCERANEIMKKFRRLFSWLPHHQKFLFFNHMVNLYWVTPHSSVMSNHTLTSNTPATTSSIYGFRSPPPTPFQDIHTDNGNLNWKPLTIDAAYSWKPKLYNLFWGFLRDTSAQKFKLSRITSWAEIISPDNFNIHQITKTITVNANISYILILTWWNS